MTVQGPVKEQRPDGMSHGGGGDAEGPGSTAGGSSPAGVRPVRPRVSPPGPPGTTEGRRWAGRSHRGSPHVQPGDVEERRRGLGRLVPPRRRLADLSSIRPRIGVPLCVNTSVPSDRGLGGREGIACLPPPPPPGLAGAELARKPAILQPPCAGGPNPPREPQQGGLHHVHGGGVLCVVGAGRRDGRAGRHQFRSERVAVGYAPPALPAAPPKSVIPPSIFTPQSSSASQSLCPPRTPGGLRAWQFPTASPGLRLSQSLTTCQIRYHSHCGIIAALDTSEP